MPFAGTINSAIAVVKTASILGALTIDILKCTDPTAAPPVWTTIFSTKITIDVNEQSSESAVQPVLSVTTFAVDDYFRINIDGAGSGAADLTVGMKVTV
jgi:hypothetical protein